MPTPTNIVLTKAAGLLKGWFPLAVALYFFLGFDSPLTPARKFEALQHSIEDLKASIALIQQQLNIANIRGEWSVRLLCAKLTAGERLASGVTCPTSTGAP